MADLGGQSVTVHHRDLVESLNALTEGIGFMTIVGLLENIKLYTLVAQTQPADLGECVPGEGFRALDLC